MASAGVRIVTDHLAIVIDVIDGRASLIGADGKRVIDRGEDATAIEETMVDEVGVVIVPDDIAIVVDASRVGVIDARVVEIEEAALAIQETMVAGGVRVNTDDLTAIINILGIGVCARGVRKVG